MPIIIARHFALHACIRRQGLSTYFSGEQNWLIHRTQAATAEATAIATPLSFHDSIGQATGQDCHLARNSSTGQKNVPRKAGFFLPAFSSAPQSNFLLKLIERHFSTNLPALALFSTKHFRRRTAQYFLQKAAAPLLAIRFGKGIFLEYLREPKLAEMIRK